jgi:hypothetical protein
MGFGLILKNADGCWKIGLIYRSLGLTGKLFGTSPDCQVNIRFTQMEEIYGEARLSILASSLVRIVWKYVDCELNEGTGLLDNEKGNAKYRNFKWDTKKSEKKNFYQSTECVVFAVVERLPKK